ncbi:UDP-N-acetylglucosamine 2-epimerase [Desulfonatronospira sp.]|uniref:UDP-N-acetylglucosamine 2-epimerase n=1 Tax=Desulfonatronospira sp. TaxID=1962951 RepID=UPI0025C0A0FD|nr:UDP-N-acetylglucosamine 2-epimerase [Desulfonatronospira sp.]
MFLPLGYYDFLYLWKDASLVQTDSGGLQEETTALQIPCLTLRENNTHFTHCSMCIIKPRFYPLHAWLEVCNSASFLPISRLA